MSDKQWDKLLEADRTIRNLSPNKGMTGGDEEPQIRITLIRGFELFNTRPYHNYENWSDGYWAEAFWDGYIVAYETAEDLDDCLRRLEKAIQHWRDTDGGVQDVIYTAQTWNEKKNFAPIPKTRKGDYWTRQR